MEHARRHLLHCPPAIRLILVEQHTSIEDMRAAREALQAAGRSVGFVPTMGFLHEGHLSLVRRAVEENDTTIVSIFVNPAQFGPNMDLDRYPRDLAGDEGKLAELGVDHVFHPSAAEMYPPGFGTWVEVEALTTLLDGGARPGYFRGICTVVAKLFNVVGPERAYFGQKDLQQGLVIRRMVRDLDLPIDVRILPTVRAADGLALSSRNSYLNATDRATAPSLNRALERARSRFVEGERSAATLLAHAREDLSASPSLEIDYLEVVELNTLQRIEELSRPACMAVAADLHGTRLIDNVLLLPDGAREL